MAKFSEHRHISYVINMSCKVRRLEAGGYILPLIEESLFRC